MARKSDWRFRGFDRGSDSVRNACPPFQGLAASVLSGGDGEKMHLARQQSIAGGMSFYGPSSAPKPDFM